MIIIRRPQIARLQPIKKRSYGKHPLALNNALKMVPTNHEVFLRGLLGPDYMRPVRTLTGSTQAGTIKFT